MNEKVITRETAVAQIRSRLVLMQEEGKSICRLAAERNILCRGFHRDTLGEFRRRYSDTFDDVRELSREELEARANTWQLERQAEEGVLLSCDVQTMFYETCHGWDDFSNQELSKFCFELLGEEVEVIGGKSPAVI